MQIVESIPLLVAYLDRGLRYRLVNRRYEDWFGRPSTAFLGQTLGAVIGRRAFALARPELRKALSGQPVRFELELPSRAGTRSVEGTYVPDRCPHGAVIGIIVLIEDVTERRRAELALKESEARFRSVADTAPIMIWMAAPDGRGTYFNQAWLDFTGRPADQELGDGWADTIHPDEKKEVLATCAGAFGRREPFRMEYHMRRRDGEYRWIIDEGVPIRRADGSFVGYIGSCVDITDHRRAEQTLRESEQAQREFVANVSHEFRTPVAAIKGFAETLIGGALDDRLNRKRFLRTIVKHADRLEWLIEELLALSRLQSEPPRLRKTSFGLRPFLRGVIGGLAGIAKKAGVTVELDVPAGLKIAGDERFLHQVFENLFSNAVKFNRPGGKIRFSARRDGRRARVRVSDSGAGIPVKDMPFLFQRFYHGSNSRGKERHTGLGLHIVKRIVELHGGTIRARSVEGRGATFELTLPSGG